MDTATAGMDLDLLPMLATQVGTTGTLGMGQVSADPVFEITIAIVVLTAGGMWRD